MQITFALSGEPRGAPLSIKRLSKISKNSTIFSKNNFNLLRHCWLSDKVSKNKLIFDSFESEQKDNYLKTDNIIFSSLKVKNNISYIVLKPKVILCEFTSRNSSTDVLVLGRNDYFWPDNIFDLCELCSESKKILIPKKENHNEIVQINAINDQLLLIPGKYIKLVTKLIDKSIYGKKGIWPEECLANTFFEDKSLEYKYISIPTKYGKDRWGSERHNLIRIDKAKWESLNNIDYGPFAYFRNRLQPLKKSIKKLFFNN